jgi:hypothetical protein
MAKKTLKKGKKLEATKFLTKIIINGKSNLHEDRS